MVDKKLADHINSQIKAGQSTDRIREALLGQGWAEKDVDEALAGIKPAVKAEKTAAGPSKPADDGVSTKALAAVMVIIAVIAVAVAVFLIPMGEPPVGPECGDGTCDEGETYQTCPGDCPAPPVTADQRIVVSPATQTVNAGEEFTVSVMMYDAADLFGFQFNMNFDPSILEFRDAEEGTLLNENGGADTFYMGPTTPSPGLIKNVIVARKGQIGGVDGDGIMATITFSALSPGRSPLTLSGVKLSDSQVRATSFTITNGESIVQ